MRRLVVLLLSCLPVLAQVASDGDLCEMVVRRHASSICRTNVYGNEECLSDPYSRVCAYTIIYDNGVERISCQTCTDVFPLPQQPAVQDCWQIVNGVIHNTCDSPIILNTADGAYGLTGGGNPVSFDLNADGVPEHCTWTAPNSTVAFLALDRNHNGVIDDGSELFGNHTPGMNGTTAANGFDALAAFDANADGVINADDPVWASLLLWTDLNHNGRSEQSELQFIATSVVTGVSLDYRMIGRRDEHGNFFRYEGKAFLQHGVRQIYDVFFVVEAAP